MVVIDIVEHFVLPVEVESANVVLFQQVVAVFGYCVIELLFVILIEGNAYSL